MFTVSRARRAAVIGAIVPVLMFLTPVAARGADNETISCQGADIATPVSLTPGATMHGTLCLPPSGPAGTVFVLVPGATYNHVYWDFPHQPETYNFRLAMNRAGYATFVVDRLGTGDSTRPLSAAVPAGTQVLAVHNVIQALRSGQIGAIPFAKVILGGHSLGSLIAILESAKQHDADAVLLTGVGHRINLAGFGAALAGLGPAALDPAFAGQGYDPGYLTTRAATATDPPGRGPMFHYPATTDPVVLAIDEATKDVASFAEMPDPLLLGAVLSFHTQQINVPVLLANGQYDSVFCNSQPENCADDATLLADESSAFTPAACLQTHVLPDAGHDNTLATNTETYQQRVIEWADLVVGSGAALPPGCP